MKIIDRDKVVKGLECCQSWKCHSDECPYWEEDTCMTSLMADALKLINVATRKEIGAYITHFEEAKENEND